MQIPFSLYSRHIFSPFCDMKIGAFFSVISLVLSVAAENRFSFTLVYAKFYGVCVSLGFFPYMILKRAPKFYSAKNCKRYFHCSFCHLAHLSGRKYGFRLENTLAIKHC